MLEKNCYALAKLALVSCLPSLDLVLPISRCLCLLVGYAQHMLLHVTTDL